MSFPPKVLDFVLTWGPDPRSRGTYVRIDEVGRILWEVRGSTASDKSGELQELYICR